MLYQRYGWDYWVYGSQPEQEIEELMEVIRAEGAAAAASKTPRSGRGFHNVPGERTDQELLDQAAEAGLPMPTGRVS